jgi:Ca-activated chloride channel family protein
MPIQRHNIHKTLCCLLCILCFFVAVSFFAQQTLRVDVDLVNVFATIQDEKGEFVPGLNREDFQLYDDDEPQQIAVFEKEGEVKSAIGMLLDTSGSMVDILPFMKRGVRDFTRSLSRIDDLFVISFGTNVKLIHKPTESQKQLEQNVEVLRPWGTSVLYDALKFGMDRIGRSEHERKALIVFTDGNDNRSNVTHGQVVQEAQLSSVLLYFVAIGSPVLIDSHTLESLANISGGRVQYVPKTEPVSPVLEKIRIELSKQYYIGYYVPRRQGYHRIRLEIPGKQLRIHAKTGYLVE